MKHSAPTAPRSAAVAAAGLLALACLLGGCSSSGATGMVASDGFPAPDKEFVFDAAATALQQQGFSPDRESSSKRTWTIVTHWKTSLSPFSGQGYRDRATVTIHDVSGRPGYYFTQTQVARQFNDNMNEPSNPVVATWARETREPDLEAVINRRIEMFFLQGTVSDRFREQYGMSGSDPRMPSSSIPRVSPEPESIYPGPVTGSPLEPYAR